MRRALFRGRRVDNNQWVYGCLLEITVDGLLRYFIVPDGIDACKSKTLGEIQVEVKRDTMGQYIGVKDKNIVKIFEGDIVQDILNGERGEIYEIDGCTCRFNSVTINNYEVWDDGDEFEIEVIGNIHDSNKPTKQIKK